MARPLTSETLAEHADDGAAERAWVSMGTARAFAAAMSVLIIATVVVNRSTNALETDGAVSASEVSSGSIELSDDDNGRSLFDLADMAPGRTSSECLTITYDGTIVPVDLTLQAEIDGDLGPYLDVAIDQGSSGGFDECDGFVPDAQVFRGTLADLSDQGRQSIERLLNQGEQRVYRFQFTLQDRQEALGRVASVGFIWEVKPS